MDKAVYNYSMDGIKIHSNEELDSAIQKKYVSYLQEKNPRKIITDITLIFKVNEVKCSYKMMPEQFERIRRITGYLVGTLDRFNDSKKAEEKDRVKHVVVKN